MDRPSLTEPGIKSFMGKTLREYHKYKDSFNSMIFNIVMLIVFILVLGGVLYWRYKGRLTPQEHALKQRKKKEYIFSKLQTLSGMKKKNTPNLITDLPTWDTHPELGILNRKNM